MLIQGRHAYTLTNRRLAVGFVACSREVTRTLRIGVAASMNSRSWTLQTNTIRRLSSPSSRSNSWYADNPNDPTINYETFVADIFPQWVDSHFSTTGTEKNLLIGYSKSGYGALDLELKHPSVFSAVAAFDFPGDMSSYDDFGQDSAVIYGTEANF